MSLDVPFQGYAIDRRDCIGAGVLAETVVDVMAGPL